MGNDEGGKKVLYIASVGTFGGSSRSLFEALRGMPRQAVSPHFVMPDGTAVEKFGSIATGIVVAGRGLTKIDNTRYSYYRGLRWLVLLRELAYFPRTLAALLRAKRRWPRIDLIHANELTDIVPLLIAKRLWKVPAIVHVRSVTRTDPRSLRLRLLHRVLRRHIAAIVAIDENVRAALPADLPITVIHNSFAKQETPPVSEEWRRRLNELRARFPVIVGYVGSLHVAKGILEFVSAAARVANATGDIAFIVVGGETRRMGLGRRWALRRLGLAQDVRPEVTRLVQNNRIEERFHILGAVPDAGVAYEAMNILCHPGHADAPGRPVFEAAFYRVPAVVSVTDPRPDTLIDGETGVAIRPKDAEQLAEAILRLANDPTEVRRLGDNAHALAKANFDPVVNASALLTLYEEVLRGER